MVVVVEGSNSLVSSAEGAPSPSTPRPGNPGGEIASGDDGSPTVVWDFVSKRL
jgi:hypothetical protein